jgi:hypothetical protein
MTWSTKLADFVSHQGRPEFRAQATQVIRELDRFDNPEAINGITPMDLHGAIGIGINHQRKKWFLLGAALFWGLLIWFSFGLGPMRLREVNGDLSAWLIILPLFGGFGLLFVLLFLKKPGPDVVAIATPTSFYLVSRAGLRFAPKEVVVPWSEERVLTKFQTITNKGVTSHILELQRQRRDGGRKTVFLRARVDPQLFGYWEAFANEFARFT